MSVQSEALGRVPKHYHRKAISGKKNEMSMSVTSLVQGGQKAKHSSMAWGRTLDWTLAHPLKSSTPVHNNITPLSQKDRDATLASAPEVNARLERILAHVLKGATPLHAPPPPAASMAYTREELLTNDQSSCPFFSLPPELRNTIYTYVFYSKYSLPQFQ